MRQEMRTRAAKVEPRQRAHAGERVAELIRDAPGFQATPRIALFAALPDELPTALLFEACRRAGKLCLLPRCVQAGRLEFAVVERWQDLERGHFGILEPSSQLRSTPIGAKDLVVVPGLAFGPEGQRLGRGRVYYDRLLSPFVAGSPIRLGLGYHCQLASDIPTEAHDLRVHGVLAGRGIKLSRA